jgi:hypothetical protein
MSDLLLKLAFQAGITLLFRALKHFGHIDTDSVFVEIHPTRPTRKEPTEVWKPDGEGGVWRPTALNERRVTGEPREKSLVIRA